MYDEQNQLSAVTAPETETLSDPNGEMNVSTFTIVELSRDEMEQVAGARANDMKMVIREDIN